MSAAAAALLASSPALAQERPAQRPAQPPEARPAPRPGPVQGAPAAIPGPPPAPKVAWDPRWPRFHPGEYVATGVFAVAAAGSFLIEPVESRWTARNGFDGALRDGLRLRDSDSSAVAKGASDVLIGALMGHLAVDALAVAWWHHGEGGVAAEMLLMDAEAVMLGFAVQGVVAGLASRQRPFGVECAGPEAQQHERCGTANRYRSFFSGHTTGAFTAAGLTCMHHAHLPLYGGGAADTLACAGAFAAAATVGTLRVVADQHFGTDVLVGATWGTLVGLGLPWLLHYRGGASEEAPAKAARAGEASIRLVPGPLGGAVIGVF